MPSDFYNASVSSVVKDVTLGADHNIKNDIVMNMKPGCSSHPTLPGASNSVMTAISPSLNHIPHSSMPQATKSKNQHRWLTHNTKNTGKEGNKYRCSNKSTRFKKWRASKTVPGKSGENEE